MVSLKNGVIVANFSSPHTFVFTDGTVLEAVDKSVATSLSVHTIEHEDEDGDVSLEFRLSENVINEMDRWMVLYAAGKVDRVLIPFPMLTAMKEAGWNKAMIKASPFRVIRLSDRVTRQVSTDKWCI